MSVVVFIESNVLNVIKFVVDILMKLANIVLNVMDFLFDSGKSSMDEKNNRVCGFHWLFMPMA